MPLRPYGETAGVRLLRRLDRSGSDLFTTQDAIVAGQALGFGPRHVWVLLHHLAAAGRVARLKKGIYARVDPATGSLRAHPFAIGAALVTPSAISHWSALQHWGLTEQIPSSITLSSPARTVPPPDADRHAGRAAWTVEGVAYEFVAITQERFFGVESVWLSERDRVPIFDRERALLDAFHHFHVFGSFSEAFGLLEEHLGRLDVDRLVAYAIRLRIGAVAKRVGWALDRLGVPAERLEPLRAHITESDVPLDPGLPRRGPHDPSWHVIHNLDRVVEAARAS